MASIYDMTASATLTTAVERCDLNQEVTQILNYARNGTAYLQIIGSPRKTYEVICYATRAQVPLFETAWANGNRIRVTVRNDEGNQDRLCFGYIIEFEKDYMGYLYDRSGWKDYYKITMKLLYTEQNS